MKRGQKVSAPHREMSSFVRTPAVAGRFYPARAEELLHQVRAFTGQAEQRRARVIGCVAPHAGYMYSGAVAGTVYARVEIPVHCVLLCPNHTGKGVPLAAMATTTWQTPLGDVPPDSEICRRLMQRFPPLEEDSVAHKSEHAIEVQLPFLQTLQPNLKIVPIAVGTSRYEVLRGLGEALAEVIAAFEEQRKEPMLIIASSDMNHYEPDDVTRRKDKKAIDQVLGLDARGLWEVVTREDISMCGLGPTVIMLTAAKLLGATKATLVKYATSGDVSGDYSAVVGYAGMVVE
jgi:MEMO1 family protein